MSWNITIVGRDKEKLKEAVRKEQCADEETNPHNGVPSHVVDLICKEIDRTRVYEWKDKTYGIYIQSNGSFHEQGRNEFLEIKNVQMGL